MRFQEFERLRRHEIAVHFATGVLSDDSLDSGLEGLVRALVSVATVSLTPLDSILSHLLMVKLPDDVELLEEIENQAGQVLFPPSKAQIGPDAAMVA